MSSENKVGQETVAADTQELDREIVEARVRDLQGQYRLATTRVMGWAAVVVLVVEVIAWLAFRDYLQFAFMAGFTSLVMISSGLYRFLHRQGYGQVGTYLVFASMLLHLFAAVLIPEVLPAMAIGTVLIALLSYQLLGSRESLLFIVLDILVFTGVVVLANTWTFSQLPALEETVGLVFSAASTALFLTAVIFVVRSIVVGQESQFRQAQYANLEVERRVAAEQEQRQQLQQANQEIEKRAASEREQRQRLEHVLTRIRDAARDLNSAAAEITASSTQQASGASEQSAAIVQATSTIDQVRVIAEQTAQRAQAVANLAQRTAQVATAGQQSVSDTVQGMQDVREKADTIARSILTLSDQAQAIGGIIATVTQIASQSKMLALNASVEAARAGDAGAGFTVVAQEVRNLAAQSRTATEQVREILTEIQRGVNTAVMAAEEGIKGAAVGLKLAGEAGQSIQSLADSVVESTESAGQITAAAGQQLSGMEQISSAMGSIHQVTVQSASGAQQVEKAARDMNRLAGQLWELVEQE
jgi:methyl-accepting chemotaxis protein